jgi:hypothetical protein
MPSSRAFLRVFVTAVVATGITAVACGDDSADDGPRFGDDASFVSEGGGSLGDGSCEDAFPPCATIDDSGIGSDLDAPSETPKDAGPNCDYPNTCQTATDMGSIQADDGSATKTYEGTTSRWVGIRVTEDDNGPRAHTMKVMATLTVPPGTNYDLYMYMDTGSDTVTCSKLDKKSTGAGTATESVEEQWGESGFFANGGDDSRPIRFEVRHIAGACSPTAKWKLVVAGNK